MKVQFSKKIWSIVLPLIFTSLLSACVSGPSVAVHSFSFSVVEDSRDYEILAYKYGDGTMLTTSSDMSIRQFGKSRQGTNVYGAMPVGDSLYVKWRNKSTDQIFEKTVNLKPLLPKDMTNQRIHFVVGEGKLFVYLKDTNHYAKPTDPIIGPFKVQLFVTRQIFP